MPTSNPGSSSYSIYDPTLPNRIATGVQQAPQAPPTAITSTAAGQGPQYNPSFGADTSPEGGPPTPAPASPATALTYPPSFGATGDYAPSPLGSALGAAASVKGNYLNRSLGNVDARGAPYPMHPAASAGNTGPGGANVNHIFSNLDPTTFDGSNSVQTAQAPASATPQGWNLFAALGQALSHLLGFNAQGQPQGMTGLVKNPVQAAPAQTLRMAAPVQQAGARYQGRTLVG
jgi:hypothetical protein